MTSIRKCDFQNAFWRIARNPGPLIGFALMLFVTLCNPFGLSDASDRNTETWLQRLFSPFYSSAAQDQVVVLLIDDESLERLHLGWPLRYDEHARLLRRLLNYQPRAVFVDMLYSQRRGPDNGTEGLVRLFERYRERGVPLLLADYREDGGRSRVLPELASAATLAQVSWSGYGDRYPLQIAGAAGDPRTPALQLRQIGCREDCAEADFQAPLLLRWGYWQDPYMRHYQRREGCAVRGTRSAWAELRRLISDELFRAQQDVARRDRPQPCSYTRTLYLDQLGDPRDAELLRDRYVLIGADLRGIPDVVISPVQGQLPAVYSHAMALDNLLSEGSGYWREAGELFFGLSLSDCLELGLVLLAGLVAIFIPEQPRPRGEGFWRWARSRYWCWFLLLTLITAALCALFSFGLHLAPLDVFGLLTMIALFYGYLAEPRLADWWQRRRFLQHVSHDCKEQSKC